MKLEIRNYLVLVPKKTLYLLLESQSMHIEVFEDDVMYNFYEIFEISEPEKGIKIP